MAKGKGERRAARVLTEGELRERGRRRQDRDTRQLLDHAEQAAARCYVTTDLADFPPVAVLQAPRQVSFPADAPGRRTTSTWDAGTITMTVEPWRPAPGDPEQERSWGGAGWTADLVRQWLSEAMETLRHCRSDGPVGGRSSMPAVVHQAELAYGWAEATIRVLPTPAELARLDVVLEWIMLFDDLATRKALVGVAMGLPLRRIARSIRRSHTHVASLERAAVGWLVGALNGDD